MHFESVSYVVNTMTFSFKYKLNAMISRSSFQGVFNCWSSPCSLPPPPPSFLSSRSRSFVKPVFLILLAIHNSHGHISMITQSRLEREKKKRIHCADTLLVNLSSVGGTLLSVCCVTSISVYRLTFKNHGIFDISSHVYGRYVCVCAFN